MNEREKKKENRIKRCVGVIVFWVILSLLLGNVYRVFSWKDGSGGYYTPVETFYGLERNIVDVLFLGSSHCYCSVINAKLWEEYGMASYSLSISGQDLAASYYWMKEALKTQKPKVVCLEVFGITYHGYLVKGNMYRNVLQYRLSGDYIRMVKDIVDEDERDSFLTKWPILHTRYAELQREDFSGESPLYIGYQSDFEVHSIDWMNDGLKAYTGDEVAAIGEEEEKWLWKIIALAEDNGVELCFFLSPYTASVQEQKQFNYVGQIAEEKGIPFLNFIQLQEVLGLEPYGDFIDWGHTNVWGAQKVTAYLGEFLSDHYSLEMHWGDEKYDLWERDCAVRANELTNYELQQIEDIYQILDYVCYLTGYTVILSTSGDYLRETDYLSEKLEPLRIQEPFLEGRGIWIIEDGEVVLEIMDQNFHLYEDRNGADITLIGTEDGNTVIVDGQNCGRAVDGINIVFYDNAAEKTACVVGFSAPDGYACIK